MGDHGTTRKQNPSKASLDGDIVRLGPGVAVYKTHASQFWQVRVRDPRIARYVVRSTKETSRLKAQTVAWEIARDIQGGAKPVQRKMTFDFFADRFLAQGTALVKAGERNKNYNRTARLFLDNKEWGLLKTFGHRDVRELKTRDFQDFMNRLAETRPDLSTSTRNMLMATFRNVLKAARDCGAIEAIPSTPRSRQKDNPRAFFQFEPLVPAERDDYARLRKAAKVLAGEGVTVRGIRITDELYDIILFVTHSFVRPTISELYSIKHSDVTSLGSPHRLQLRIRKGKTGFRYSATMPAAVSVYQRIVARYPDHQPEDYIFLPGYTNRETAGRIIQRQFRFLLNRLGLDRDPSTGAPYSIYSLRHTAICMRLVNSGGKVNVYSLAKNAGTSVDQIERFYARNLPLSESLIRNLQSFQD